MNQELIRELSQIVETACKSKNNKFGYGIWSHHIKPMIEISRILSKKYNADEEIVLIATLLHDLAGISDSTHIEEHHIYGAIDAERILNKYEFPTNRIEMVKKCIINHRGSINNKKETIEEICVADADAISHIEEIASLFYVVYVEKNMGIDEGSTWIKAKISRDWNKMSEKSKKLYKDKYETILSIVK
jgi:uncharacterized protein